MQNNFSTASFGGDRCWQYEIKKANLANDLAESGLTHAKIATLRVSDFKLSYVPKEDKETCQKVKEFIVKHEWLGKMPHRPTHRFIATYGDKLAGAIVMATPNTFSHIFGRKKDSRDREKLISRGACISWSPKNLASSLVMFSIRWMAKNTPYRFFSAYSDPQALELGTIYQACNFIYLGQNSGARFKYFDPGEPQREWFNDRIFRKSNSFKKYALALGITWQKNWGHRDKIYWSEIPDSIATQLKNAAKEHQSRCRRQRVPRKHKYVYILGQDKRETKKLRQCFAKLNPDKINLAYPKQRVPQNQGDEFRENCPISQKKFYSVREISKIYGISQWAIYQHIKNDPSFPHINIGAKKRFLIGLEQFNQWMEKKGKHPPLFDSRQLLEDNAA